MNTRRILLVGLFCFLGAVALGALNIRTPQIGYLYPAGGQKGTVVRITVGGQFLQGAAKVHVTGDGVSAEVVEYFRPIGNLNKEKRVLLNARFKEVMDKRISELPPNIRTKINAARKPKTKRGAKTPQAKKAAQVKKAAKDKKATAGKKDDKEAAGKSSKVYCILLF